MKRQAVLSLLLLSVALLTPGCLYTRYTSNTQRSATEQLLISTAAQRAVDAVELPEVSGRRVSVRVVGLGHIDKDYDDLEYLRTALEQRLLRAGGIVAKREAAELRMTAMVGSIGTAERHFTLGTQVLGFGVFAIAKQHGYTKLSLLTQDASGRIVADSPPVIERAYVDIYELMMVVWRDDDIYPEQWNLAID